MTPRRASKALAIAVGIVVVTVVLVRSGDEPYVVRAEFDNAAGLRQDFRVTLGGVSVGKIADVSLSTRDTAIATLEIDASAGPIGRDAEATIAPTNLLGEKVVQLAPGDLRDPAPSGATIPRRRTATPVELDDVFDTFDTPTRSALALFLVEQGDALLGRGGDVAATLEGMPPALHEARRLVDTLATDNRALGRLIERSDRVVATIARERAPLGRVVDSAGNALATLGSRRAGLAGTVRNAPGAFRQLRASLQSLQRTAAPLIPAARGLRTAAPSLATALRELPPFVDAAQPALRTVKEAAPSLRRLGREGAPVVRRLVPAAAALATFARDGAPALGAVHEARDDMMGLIEGWARATQSRDALGHVFRVEATVTGDMSALLKDYLAPPPKRGKRRARPGTLPTTPGSAPRPQDVRRPALKRPAIKVPAIEVGPLKLPAIELPTLELPSTQERPAGSELLDFLLAP